jgi:hypothetical protein
MALKSLIAKLRFNRKVEQLKENAVQEIPARRSLMSDVATAFVLAFVGLITSLGIPSVAADSTFTLPSFNFTPIGDLFGSLLDAGTAIGPHWTSFLNAWVGPAIETIAVFAVCVLIVFVFIYGPAKVFSIIEKGIEKIINQV